jgi:hypothetical protein
MPPAATAFARTALAAGLLLASSAASAEWREIPYSDVAKMPLLLAKVDSKHVFSVAMFAKPGKDQTGLPADYQLKLRVGGKELPVTVQPDGHIDLAFRQDWADAGAVLLSNAPKGRVAVAMNLNSRVPPGTRMSYAQLCESAEVLDRGISEYAGVMSFLAPDVTVVLKFAKPPQSMTLTLPDGKKKSYTTDAKGQISLPWQPKWSAGQVELSAPLSGIDQIMK